MFERSRPAPRNQSLPAAVSSVLTTPGEPLRPADESTYGSHFGLDLSSVRVHADTAAADSASGVGARAYTVGRHVAFGAGEYRPDTVDGQALLAHELSHVAQQGAPPDGALASARGAPSPTMEAQADAMVSSGRAASTAVVGVASPALMRWDSPEHVTLGDASPGGPDEFITLACHARDFPERADPARWPARWRALLALGTDDQRRAVTRGLTYGEIVALSGDFYESVDALDRASLYEIYDLVPLIRKGADTGALQAATGGRYLALAAKNVSHFSTGPAGRTNLDVWREMHEAAIADARAAQGDPARRNLAWARNAAADHFLTDAFSAGHMRTPRADLAAQGALGDIESKILHDLDNEHGVDVTNARGDRPTTAFGDDHLDDPANAVNRSRALDAVALSKRDIATAIADPAAVLTRPYAAEELVPRVLKPDVDRWSGRTPRAAMSLTGGAVPVLDDRSLTAWRVVRSEGPDVVTGALSSEDDDVREWVDGNPLDVIGHQSTDEKIRMVDTLLGGLFSWITDDDIDAVEKICRSVGTETEMEKIRFRFDGELAKRISSIGQRTRVRIALRRL